MSFSVSEKTEKSDTNVVKDEPSEEPTTFVETNIILTPEEVNEIIKKSIAFGINEEEIYAPEKLNKWCTNITEECIQRLADLKKPFKYIVFCDVTQNMGNGMHHTITTYWDRLKDRVYTQAWSNTTIFVVVTVLGVCTEITRETIM